MTSTLWTEVGVGVIVRVLCAVGINYLLRKHGKDAVAGRETIGIEP
jgi:hypothetical protein